MSHADIGCRRKLQQRHRAWSATSQSALGLGTRSRCRLSAADDPTVLEWAAQEGRVLLTHDVSTITRYAYDRVKAGKSLPGVFEVSRDVPIRVAIEDILLLAEYSLDDEWEGQIRYLPLR